MSDSEVPSSDIAHGLVRDRYAKIATLGGCCSSPESDASGCSCNGAASAECCGGTPSGRELGYSESELASLPDGADLGLGCGNPTALLALRPGQVVLDLGSGAGIDCFLAARKVGLEGRVIGVDMTYPMIEKARENARRGAYLNVEFRLGEIEHLPVADESVDVVISNCVINLAPEKDPVYREAFRVLRPGGELAISDVVATRPIAEADRVDPVAWSSCSSGALSVPDLTRRLRRAGFRRVRVRVRTGAQAPASLEGPATLGVVAAEIRAVRPQV